MLAGTLNDVSLPEVLALLSHAEKTGSVHVVGDGMRGRIDLISGAIAMAQSHVGKLGLVRRLVVEGQLDADALAPGLEAAAVSPDPDIQLVRSAYKAGAVTAEQVRAVVDEHIIDAMFDLDRVESGRFRFDPCRVADLGVQRPPEDVLEDVAARAQEWEQIRDSIPAPGAIVRMLPRIEQDEVAVSPATWQILALIDGRRSVADLVDLLGHGEFQLSRLLHRLVEARLVEVTVDVGEKDADGREGADHVLSLELELANLRSDPASELSGKLDWDRGAKTSPDNATGDEEVEVHVAQAEDEPATPVAADEDASSSDHDHEDTPSSTLVLGEPADGEVPVDDWSDVEMPDGDGESLGIDDDEPEVFSTQVEGVEDEDEPAVRRPKKKRPGSKVSLAATTERRGRLLPEPEPGHDAADLTRRLLEGVGKS